MLPLYFICVTIYLTCVAAGITGTGGPAKSKSFTPKSKSTRHGQCNPFSTNFTAGSVSQHPLNSYTTLQSTGSPFIAISPRNSYDTASGGGLTLYLRKPKGEVETHDGVNNIVSDGATINSTFVLQYGKVTFDVKAPTIAGVVTAAILIADQHDEIDVELVGGDPHRWQSNIYAPKSSDKQPLWGVFGGVHAVGGTIGEFHKYSIEWNESEITWSVDGRVVRSLSASKTMINGTIHFPTHPSRIQLGIWDASSPIGTSEWAKGPIDWKNAPETISAVVRSVVVECP
ncbi:concanavalin A-like lectin/glucanase [Rickenella mellea]|uniref:Concanavalin A-like lectin/glucanase n=1 Tax=Rickenella mellea TaxID=50990 RepID=A0A4Y7PXY5_9AGAM|nr:concanavalin A-like lectin/glucanase [Rickenella mellea]